MSITRAAQYLSGADIGKTVGLSGKSPHGRIKSVEHNSGFTIINVYPESPTSNRWIPPLAIRRDTEVTITETVVGDRVAC